MKGQKPMLDPAVLGSKKEKVIGHTTPAAEVCVPAGINPCLSLPIGRVWVGRPVESRAYDAN